MANAAGVEKKKTVCVARSGGWLGQDAEHSGCSGADLENGFRWVLVFGERGTRIVANLRAGAAKKKSRDGLGGLGRVNAVERAGHHVGVAGAIRDCGIGR